MVATFLYHVNNRCHETTIDSVLTFMNKLLCYRLWGRWIISLGIFIQPTAVVWLSLFPVLIRSSLMKKKSQRMTVSSHNNYCWPLSTSFLGHRPDLTSGYKRFPLPNITAGQRFINQSWHSLKMNRKCEEENKNPEHGTHCPKRRDVTAVYFHNLGFS